MKKLFITLAAIIVVLLIALVAIADHALEMAIHPDNNKTRDIALCYSKVYNAYPELEQWHDSLVANGLWRDTMIVAGDGSMRHGLILQHDSVPTGASIVVHGYTDNAPIMLRYVYLHYEVLGRNVVVPEHYAHGESDGDDIRFGWPVLTSEICGCLSHISSGTTRISLSMVSRWAVLSPCSSRAKPFPTRSVSLHLSKTVATPLRGISSHIRPRRWAFLLSRCSMSPISFAVTVMAGT